MPLSDIVDEISRAHDAGHDVARLHSGDLSLYSALAEQLRELERLGVGLRAGAWGARLRRAAAALGRELTVPEVGQSLLITRVSTLSTDMPSGEELGRLADTE